MSDGHGSTPETPPGWATEQPPPYGAPQASPWTAPGQGPHPSPGYQQGPPYQYQQQQQQPYQPYGYMPPPPALRPGIIPLRPLGLGDILDGTIKLIRSNPKAVLGLSTIAALLVAVPVAIGQAFVLDKLGSSLTDPTQLETEMSYGGFLSQYGGALISQVVSFIVVTLLTGVLMRILGRAVFGGNLTAGEAWRLARSRMPALFGLVGLLAVIMLAPLALIIPVFVLLFTAGSSPGAIVGTILLTLLLYIVYVLFFNTRFALAAPAVVLEGLGPLQAMRRSWNLVNGDFWRVLGILILTSLLAGLVGGILGFPFTLAGTFIGVLGGGGAGTAILTAILIAVGGTLTNMITLPFEAGVSGLLYADRRMRSEAFDLVLQTAAIEQQRQGWVHGSADELWHPSNAARPPYGP
ncbi:glycerophosphoryl diester phosphodiesterase membrane domain-containing protein [Nonomuraea sp. NPDC050536]|uniref:glycerophosphoryl diester phosphodiesterase membrane domain-containing protein n=1 Tax=Nonomuraea sp. NPDC050536 TaxID=3364366 RepID=UPI0037CC0A84